MPQERAGCRPWAVGTEEPPLVRPAGSEGRLSARGRSNPPGDPAWAGCGWVASLVSLQPAQATDKNEGYRKCNPLRCGAPPRRLLLGDCQSCCENRTEIRPLRQQRPASSGISRLEKNSGRRPLASPPRCPFPYCSRWISARRWCEENPRQGRRNSVYTLTCSRGMPGRRRSTTRSMR